MLQVHCPNFLQSPATQPSNKFHSLIYIYTYIPILPSSTCLIHVYSNHPPPTECKWNGINYNHQAHSLYEPKNFYVAIVPASIPLPKLKLLLSLMAWLIVIINFVQHTHNTVYDDLRLIYITQLLFVLFLLPPPDITTMHPPICLSVVWLVEWVLA